MAITIAPASLPARLRAARQAMGLARIPVARALRILVSRLARWETGRGRVPLSAVLRLAQVYGCGVGFLLTGGGSEAPGVSRPRRPLLSEGTAAPACVRVPLAPVDAARRARQA